MGDRVKGLALAVLALALAAPGTHAQSRPGTISGTVVAQDGGLPLPGARVRVDDQDRVTLTGQDGRFVLANVPAGAHRVTVSYLGYGAETRDAAVAAGSDTPVEFRLRPAALALDGITVQGQRQGQARALNQQLTATNITNVVAADQIGRFPDANIGDAVKRIPGITALSDQGEARFVSIRGTEPRFNSVTLNGERIPSAEGDVRQVQLDLVPSDMVAAVEVTKALTPDMDADAIGGAVNIVTRAAPPATRLSATLGSGYNLRGDNPMAIASGVAAGRLFDDRLGIVVSGSYFDHDLGSDDIEASWAEGEDTPGAFVEEFEIRRYEIRRTRRSVSAALDWRISPGNTVTLDGMYNHRDDWENRYRLLYEMEEPDADGVQEAVLLPQTKGGIGGSRGDNARLEDQRVRSLQLRGEHLLPFGMQADWSVSWARASEDTPDERYIEWESDDVPVRADLSNPRKPRLALVDGALSPGDYAFGVIEDIDGHTHDRDVNGRFDLRIPFSAGRTTLQAGVRVRDKGKARTERYAEVSPADGGLGTLAEGGWRDFTERGFLAGDYRAGVFTRASFLGGLDLGDDARFEREEVLDEFIPGNYDADERVTAGYAMLTRRMGDRLTVIAGVRVEDTDLDYRGFELNVDEEEFSATEGSDRYTSVLPGVHLRYEPSAGTVFRAAWSNTLARPNYYDLVPYRIIVVEDDELELGNPDLRPTTSMNWDLMGEHYFRSVGLVSAGVFYKNVDDFIYAYGQDDAADPLTGTVFSRVTQPQNGSDAELWGLELALQRTLAFLPGALRNLSVYGNYTFTDSKVSGLGIEDRDESELPLPGQARHVANASLGYDTRTLSLRGSLNFQSAFLDPDGLGDAEFYDRWYDRSTHVDVNGSLLVSRGVRLFVEANNLTNQPLRYYQGVRSRVMQEEYYDRRFSAGFKYDF